jgi:XTP/dITP diphosphohydrolase
MTLRLVVATGNPDKAREIRAVLEQAGADVELVPRPGHVPEVEETGTTLVENARLKAEALRDATGLAALGEDTGLEVDALGGAPGVFSARYAGADATYADNVAKLLDEVDRVRRASRTARFRTVVVLSRPDGSEIVVEGVVEGVIVDAPRGAGGFGYDPVFAPAGAGGRTFAELAPDRKHAISHRGRALRAFATRLREAGTRPEGDRNAARSAGEDAD